MVFIIVTARCFPKRYIMVKIFKISVKPKTIYYLSEEITKIGRKKYN